ncbi:MAG: hypothetical protein ABL973_01655 [Micropepsaceae bacterium]
MKPTPELVLNQAFGRIAFEMGPALPAGYGQGSAMLIGVQLLLVSQEFNRAAAVRVTENDAMRDLFAEYCGKVEPALRGDLRQAADSKDADILVSTLEKSNAELKKVLIRLQETAENASDKVLEARILAMLQAWAAARQVFLPAM